MIHIKKDELYKLAGFSKEELDSISLFISYLDKMKFQKGKIQDPCSKLYCFAQEYETHVLDLDLWEKHDIYYDVQYLQYGTEISYYNPKNILSIHKAYDSQSDCEIVSAQNSDYEIVEQGEIIIFEPGEYHNTGVINNEIQKVRKFVIKCRRS